MSDIEEPPAKVLKIDNVNGNHLLETSVIIDKSLSELATASGETEEGQEEWLSEEVLTDDDYNNVLQAENPTDSQLGSSSLDESQINNIERLDTSIDSEPCDGQETSKIGDETTDIEENDDTANTNDNDETANTNDDDATANVNDNNATANTNDNDVTADNDNDETADTNDNDATANANDFDETANTNDSDKTDDEIEEQEQRKTVKMEHVATTQKDMSIKGAKTTDNLTKEGIPGEEITVTTVIDCAEKIANSKLKMHANVNLKSKDKSSDSKEQNIEETIEHLDGDKDVTEQSKVDSSKNSEQNKNVDIKNEAEDENDTDDLLRMLEDDGKTKKLTKTVKDIRRVTPGDASSDDDDFVYEGVTKKVKAAKTMISKKQPTKAVSEDFEDSDDDEQSDDEAATLRRVFGTKGLTKSKKNTETNISRNSDYKKSSKNSVTLVERPSRLKPKTPDLKENEKSNEKLLYKPTFYKEKCTPLKQYAPAPSRSILKTPKNGTESNTALSSHTKDNKIKFKSEVLTPGPFRSRADASDIDDVMMDDDEHRDDDDRFNTDDDFGESDLDDMPNAKQNMMNPETMDEEVPSDCDTHSDDGSLYDELPSSDSEDMDDWFGLDIRAEKAGDYLPLLGSRAMELLQEEKRCVSLRLKSLRQSVSALTDSGRQQADQLREATMTLAHIDDMIKAT